MRRAPHARAGLLLVALAAIASLGLFAGCRTAGGEPLPPPEPCSLEYGDGEGGRCAAPSSLHEITWSYGSGALCTRECGDELDCPSLGTRRARCVKVSASTPFLCYLECGGGEGCPGGQVCQPIRGGGRICLP